MDTGEQVRSAVAEAIRRIDAEQQLGRMDHDDILATVAGKVLEVLGATQRDTLEECDHAFIQRSIAWMILNLENPEDLEEGPRRFQPRERVICQMGGGRWAPGVVHAVDRKDPADPLVNRPYTVKIDKPIDALVSVPLDNELTVRAEVCFDQPDFTRMCLPQLRSGRPQALRFRVGDRVACAVKDATVHLSVWAAGTVFAVHHTMEGLGGECVPVPYQVKLDDGSTVLVHRDEQWLVRDLELQPEGPRQAHDGSRCTKRMEKRRRTDGGWEEVDHQTCRVRPMSAVLVDSDDDSGDCAKHKNGECNDSCQRALNY